MPHLPFSIPGIFLPDPIARKHPTAQITALRHINTCYFTPAQLKKTLESSLSMDVLGFPLEAFFLGDYCSATARSLWAWIAVLAAAVSFWRITAAGSRPHDKSSDANPSFHDQLRPKAESTKTEAPQETPQPDLTPAESKAAELAAFVRDDGGRKGVKFAAYYCEVDDGDVRNEEEDEEEEAVGRTCDGVFEGVWGFDAGFRMMIQLPVVRTGDLGWYRCQDMRALNGSVVRLWDGGKRRSLR